MGSSQSDHEFHCPECGALLTVGADHCWKCRREFIQTQADAESPSKPTSSTTEGGGSYGLPPFQSKARRQPLSSRERTIFILKTLGILAIIVVAASAAFFGTCLGGFSASSAIGPGGEAGLGQAIGIGLISGSVAALVVIVGLGWLFWLRPRKKRRLRQ
jgi:hypothetical protein